MQTQSKCRSRLAPEHGAPHQRRTIDVGRFDRPAFLAGRVSVAQYRNWLYDAARRHAKRDRERHWPGADARSYATKIHTAVLDSGGRDAYTGRRLDWELIGTYDNDRARGGGAYCTTYENLPTVDHLLGEPPAVFRICSWQVNRAKGSGSVADFRALCREVVAHEDDWRETFRRRLESRGRLAIEPLVEDEAGAMNATAKPRRESFRVYCKKRSGEATKARRGRRARVRDRKAEARRRAEQLWMMEAVPQAVASKDACSSRPASSRNGLGGQNECEPPPARILASKVELPHAARESSDCLSPRQTRREPERRFGCCTLDELMSDVRCPGSSMDLPTPCRRLWLAPLAVLVALLALAVPRMPLQAQDGDADTHEFEAQQLQKEALERFRKFEARLERLAEKLEESDPERARRLREAGKRCTEELVGPHMADLVRLLEDGKLAEAAELQKEVERSLRHVLSMLMEEGADPDDTREQREAMAERLEAIEDLIEEQKENLDATRERSQNSDSLAEREGDLADDTRQLSGDAPPQGDQGQQGDQGDQGQPGDQGDQGSQSEPRESQPGDAALQRAAEQMEQAEEQLQNGQPGDSEQAQQQALEELEQARREAQEALEQAEEDHREAMISKLESILAEMIKKQEAVNSDTDDLAARADAVPNRRVLLLQSRKIANGEREVRELQKEFDEVLADDGEEFTTLRVASETIGEQLDHITMRLDGALLDDFTRQMEADVLDLMRAMQQALKDARQQMQQQQNEQAEQDPQQQDQQQQDQQPQDPSVIPEDADLKLMREMQAQLNEQTRRFHEARNPGVTTEDETRMLQQLAARQAKIVKLMQDYLRRKHQQDGSGESH